MPRADEKAMPHAALATEAIKDFAELMREGVRLDEREPLTLFSRGRRLLVS
jgi:hypothetical protein